VSVGESGVKVARFSVATDRYSNKERITDWHKVVAFRNDAEAAEKHLSKGTRVAVRGAIAYRTYKDANGAEQKTTEILADRVEVLFDGKREEVPQTAQTAQPQRTEKPQPTTEQVQDDSDLMPF